MVVPVRMSATTKVDVAIIGGGPGGLAAANAVRVVRPDLNVRVYERSVVTRRQGNLFAFHANGQSALRAINPAINAKLWDTAINFEGVRFDDFEKVINGPPLHKQIGEVSGVDTDESLFLAWFVMRDTLASFLPSFSIQMGYELDQVELQDSGTGRLMFSNRDEVVEARIVIGCDGNRSQVRKCILKDGDPRLMNASIARGVLNAPKDWPNPKNFINVYTSAKPAMYMILAYLESGSDLMGWQCVHLSADACIEAASSYHGTQSGNGITEKRARWLEIMEESWPQLILDIVEDTPLEQFTVHRQTYRDPAEIKKWGEGCVTLLGDSAHLATPALGLGVSMAIEDAVELGRAIGELGPTEAALRKYEQVRMPRAAKVHAGSTSIYHQRIRDRESAMSELDWYAANPWCITATFEPLLPANVHRL